MTTVTLVAAVCPSSASSLRLLTYTDISDRARSERLGAIRAELLVRIRVVCRDMPQDLFLEMVESMAALQLKYELRNVHGDG
jgi:hypothetical protein